MDTIEPWMLLGAWLALRGPKGFALSVIARVPGMRPAELTVKVGSEATPSPRVEDSTEDEPDVDP